MKVVKFGGSSLASATQFKKVHDIVLEDTDRHYVVPSAPGKRNKEDTKVTDLLIILADSILLEALKWVKALKRAAELKLL